MRKTTLQETTMDFALVVGSVLQNTDMRGAKLFGSYFVGNRVMGVFGEPRFDSDEIESGALLATQTQGSAAPRFYMVQESHSMTKETEVPKCEAGITPETTLKSPALRLDVAHPDGAAWQAWVDKFVKLDWRDTCAAIRYFGSLYAVTEHDQDATAPADNEGQRVRLLRLIPPAYRSAINKHVIESIDSTTQQNKSCADQWDDDAWAKELWRLPADDPANKDWRARDKKIWAEWIESAGWVESMTGMRSLGSSKANPADGTERSSARDK